LLIIRNLCLQGGAPGEVMENIEEVCDILHEGLQEHFK
jgi:predicted RNase H-like HicB family nuclease